MLRRLATAKETHQNYRRRSLHGSGRRRGRRGGGNGVDRSSFVRFSVLVFSAFHDRKKSWALHISLVTSPFERQVYSAFMYSNLGPSYSPKILHSLIFTHKLFTQRFFPFNFHHFFHEKSIQNFIFIIFSTYYEHYIFFM